MNPIIPVEQIQTKIFSIRGTRVMIDVDLADLYGVPNKRLVAQVRRNLNRFPPDFMIMLTMEESRKILRPRTQNASLKRGLNIKYPHMAFTESGVGMLSSVLRSARAVEVNIMMIRAFIRPRSILATHKHQAEKLEELKFKLHKHDPKFKKHAAKIKMVFDAIWDLINRHPPFAFGPQKGQVKF